MIQASYAIVPDFFNSLLVPDVGPIGTLVGTIISIITPVAIDLSTAVDQTKRKQAVLDFWGKRKTIWQSCILERR